MGIKELQLTSHSHHKNILTSLHQLRTQGQLCDVTVLVDHQGDVQEFQAHQVILAACSGFFKNILLSQDATKDKLSLSDVKSSDFSLFLEFVYTGTMKVARNKISDVQAVARLLDCESLSEVCGEALSDGVQQNPESKRSVSKADEESSDAAKGDEAEENKTPESSLLMRQQPPMSSDKGVPKKRKKEKNVPNNAKRRGKKLKLKLAGHKVVQRHWYCSSNENLYSESKDNVAEESENRTEVEPQPDKNKGDEASPTTLSSELNDWECEDDVHSIDPHDPLFLLETDEDGKGNLKEKLLKPYKAQFQCDQCQRTFHYERSYLKHISTYHGVKAEVVYSCEICQQTFANRSNLRIHEKHVHSNERLFECDHCAKAFKRKKDVVRHTKQVHERTMQHLCPECGKALSSKAALILHERTHTGMKPYECTECKTRFTQSSALKMHRRTHTGEKPFACDECDARFTQKHMLAYHKRSHTGEKPFMCEACGKSFASKEYLRHHSNIHTGSKPYKCAQCNRGFAQRNSLNQHLKIHTGERPYKCKTCDKQFTQLNALQRHQRIHTGEKPYMCGHCKRTFTDKSTLRRHTSVHDSDAPWKTFLVVLEGNVEEKKSTSPIKEKAEEAGSGEKEVTAGEGPSDAPAVSPPASRSAAGPNQTETAVVPAESITLPSDWTSHRAITLVSQGGFTVIHTEVPAGTQIQPIVATNGTGANIISLEGRAIPFSIPVSVTQSVSLSSESPSTTLSPPALSLPVSGTLLASGSDMSTVSTSSVLDAAAPSLEEKSASDSDALPPDIQTVVVGYRLSGKEPTAVVKSDEQPQSADNSSSELKRSSDHENA